MMGRSRRNAPPASVVNANPRTCGTILVSVMVSVITQSVSPHLVCGTLHAYWLTSPELTLVFIVIVDVLNKIKLPPVLLMVMVWVVGVFSCTIPRSILTPLVSTVSSSHVMTATIRALHHTKQHSSEKEGEKWRAYDIPGDSANRLVAATTPSDKRGSYNNPTNVCACTPSGENAVVPMASRGAVASLSVPLIVTVGPVVT